MRTQLLPHLSPRIKVVARGNRAANTLHLSDTPELLERLRAVDGRLVDPRCLVDVVCAAVRRDGTFLRGSRGWVVGAVGFDDVVLDERIACPAVERDVGVYVRGVPGTGVGYCATRAGVPAFAGDKVANVGPGYVVFASCLHGC